MRSCLRHNRCGKDYGSLQGSFKYGSSFTAMYNEHMIHQVMITRLFGLIAMDLPAEFWFAANVNDTFQHGMNRSWIACVVALYVIISTGALMHFSPVTRS